jgi:hypothetical protein
VAYTWIGGWSTNRGESSTANTSARSASLSRFAGADRVIPDPAGSARRGRRVALDRGIPVDKAASRVVTPAAVSSR